MSMDADCVASRFFIACASSKNNDVHASEAKGVDKTMTRFRYLVVLSALLLVTALSSWGAVAISVSFGPPALPVYQQPLCPGPGYYWVPGYWAWSPDYDDYYWVPGTWVMPPTIGLLWTPGYWAFTGGVYG